jgi:hypothetical protein
MEHVSAAGRGPTQSDSRQGRFSYTTLRTTTMGLLFAAAALWEAKNLSSLSALSNSDIWWHLRSGLWILQNHAVPHHGLFSQSPDLCWTASNWGYDVLVAFAFRTLGLRSIPALLMVSRFALACVTFLLAGGLRRRFWVAVVLSAFAQYILGSVQPGPTYVSIIWFALALLLLNQSRATGSLRILFWLPPLFLVWANLDIQFVYGIALLALFMGISFLPFWRPVEGECQLEQKRTVVSLTEVAIITALCVIATCSTPYSYHLYAVFFASGTSPASHYLSDFAAMGFRQPQDYALMLLTMAAFLALGLRHSRDVFQIALLTACMILSFYAQRTGWLAVLAAILVIAGAARDTSGTADIDCQRSWKRRVLMVGIVSLAMVVLAAALEIPRSDQALLAKASPTYPVAACNYIREHRLPQPLFTSYEWGGFLTWYLPEYPVAIDGRTGLYENEFVLEYFKAMNAEVSYKSYGAMANANTILLPQTSLMGEALKTMPAFRVEYSDSVAVVLTKP